MLNSYINYSLSQDGVITENSLTGKFEKVGNLYRVVFIIENDGNESEHSYVKLSNNSFKITVKGDSEYSLTVKEGESNNATLKAGGVVFPFNAYTYKCEVTASENGMQIYAEYDIIAFNQTIKNVLNLKVGKMGDMKC